MTQTQIDITTDAVGTTASHVAAILTNLTAAERVALANCQHPGRLAELKCNSRGCHKSIDGGSNDTYCHEHYRRTVKRAELVEFDSAEKAAA